MRTTRRRARAISPFADHDSIRALCRQVRERCPQIAPRSDRQLFLMPEAVRKVGLHPATETKRGRPSRRPRERLLERVKELLGEVREQQRRRGQERGQPRPRPVV
ncbi:MAG TPA: hypothetical protein VEY09_15260 [Pyrinomonadaceae bacterium]|nr:hypothetical protein [Pyrinomonadaceae bacterium]